MVEISILSIVFDIDGEIFLAVNCGKNEEAYFSYN